MASETESHYRRPHVFDPIHNDADECECGLMADAEIHESDDAYEARMRPRIVNAPDRIWLQTGCDDEDGEIKWEELAHSEVSWCAERIDNTDIEYVRADLAPSDAEQLMELRRLLREARQLIGELYSAQQRLSHPDTRWGLPLYRQARTVMENIDAALNPSHLQKERQT